MASTITHNNLFNSPIYKGFHYIFSKGAEVSESAFFETAKMIDKLALSILKAVPYLPAFEEMPSAIESPFKDVKLITDFFTGFRSLRALTARKFTINKDTNAFDWKTLAFNTAGLALTFFTIISGLARFKVDVKIITEAAKKVPVFGVLPYAGLMNLALLTMYGMMYLNSREKAAKLENTLASSQTRIEAKIREWNQPINEEKIGKRIDQYSNASVKPNYTEKLDEWKKISDQFATDKAAGTEDIRNFSEKKRMKWERKLGKINLEIKYNKLGKLTSGAKVAAIIVVSGATIAGFGVPAATAFAVVMGLIEAGGGCKNYFRKKSIAAYNIKPVKFNEVQTG